MVKFLRVWWSFGIWLAFALGLRAPFCRIQRRLKGEHKAVRTPVPRFSTLDGVEAYALSKFEYREDQTRLGGILIPLDYLSHPEVFQTRLEDDVKEDGDCDDIALWYAEAVRSIEGVENVMICSIGFKGGAHVVTVFCYKGEWKMFNYELESIEDPNDAPELVAQWGVEKGETDTRVRFCCFEEAHPDCRGRLLSTGKRKIPA